MKTYKLLWKKLRLIRRGKLDMLQSEVADKMGISLTTYSKYELGKAIPQPQNLVKLVEIFGKEVYREEDLNADN